MTSTEGQIHDVIVVGSGPAGYTAATYLGRADLYPLVLEGVEFGGALMMTTDVENFPGFPRGVSGPDLMLRMREQAERFGADLRQIDVDCLDLAGPIKSVTADGVVYCGRAVVLATGSAPRFLGLPSEKRLIGRGVSTCATCDGFFFRDQDIAVVGGGDSAMEEAIFLTKFASSVTIVHRRTEFRASPIMVDRAREDPKIRWATGRQVTEVCGTDRVTSLTLTDVTTGRSHGLDVNGVFVAIGHDPRSSLFQSQIVCDSDGYVLTGARFGNGPADPGATATSVDGVFACGDLVDRTYRQAITAAGSGCIAALDVQRWLAHRPALSVVSPAG